MTKSFFKRAVAAALTLALSFPVPTVSLAQDETGLTLEAVDVSGDNVTLTLTGEAQYKTITTANPPRLIVELENVAVDADVNKNIPSQGTHSKAVRTGQYSRTPLVTRVVIDLNAMTTYKVERAGFDLVVSVGAGGAQQAAAPAAAPAKAARPKVKPAKPTQAATQSAAAASQGDLSKVAGTPESVMTKVGETDGMTREVSPELDDIAKGNTVTETSLPQKDAAPSTSLADVGRSRAPRGDIMSRLPRDLVSLDFDNVDVREVLRLMAVKAKVNVIYGDDVSGVVTLHLTDVPFNDAFRTILTMTGLATMQVGENILRVLTPGQLARSQTAQASFTKVFPLNYQKASEMVASVNAVRLAEGRGGITIADQKTNSLVVTESVEGMLATERLIQQLDVRPKQVLIEAKLVEVGLNNQLHYGVQWDYASLDRGRIGGKQGLTTIGGAAGPSSENITTTIQPFDGTAVIPQAAAGQLHGGAGRGTGVNLPAQTVFGAMTLGRVTNNYFVNATLTAAAAQGKVKVLSDPKIATLNNQAASINVTTQIPYLTSNVSANGVTSQQVQYVTTGIQLIVTPIINADGRITLDINPRVSQPAAVIATGGTAVAPSIDQRDAKTLVLVRDGETIVIGGLINDSVSNQIAKIPILGDIPILGWLFKKKSVVRTRAELLIFVTTRIMPD